LVARDAERSSIGLFGTELRGLHSLRKESVRKDGNDVISCIRKPSDEVGFEGVSYRGDVFNGSNNGRNEAGVVEAKWRSNCGG
jgi:hypothetical protein